MPLKLNISQKEKSWKLEVPVEKLSGKSIADVISGKQVDDSLEGYELKITGGSDFAGFPMTEEIEGIGLKGVLRTKGWGMRDSRKGVRLRKTNRGKTVADTTLQVNLVVQKEGVKSLKEVFPDQNKAPEPKEPEKKQEAEERPVEDKKEAPTQEQKQEEVKQEAPKEEKKE